MIGIDTNVLVRIVTNDIPALADRARRHIKANCTLGEPGRIDWIVLCELAWVLRSVYGYQRPAIATAVRSLLLTNGLSVANAAAVAAALDSYEADGADLADHLLASANRAAGCEATATFDRDAARLPGFTLIA